MRALRALVLGMIATAAVATPARAHPPTILSEAGEKAAAEEVAAFRKQMADAIAAKDAGRLREMYAPSFAHTHTTGKVDNRDARIVSALAGDPVIETAQVEGLAIRVPNDWVAIATGTSPIKSMADGKTWAVRWMAVYVRNEKNWALAASQANRLDEIKR